MTEKEWRGALDVQYDLSDVPVSGNVDHHQPTQMLDVIPTENILLHVHAYKSNARCRKTTFNIPAMGISKETNRHLADAHE